MLDDEIRRHGKHCDREKRDGEACGNARSENRMFQEPVQCADGEACGNARSENRMFQEPVQCTSQRQPGPMPLDNLTDTNCYSAQAGAHCRNA
jgi:hypothetical protein